MRRKHRLIDNLAIALIVCSGVLEAVGGSPTFAETDQDVNLGLAASSISGEVESHGELAASPRTGLSGPKEAAWVTFENGDPNQPIWLGSLWNDSDTPPK
jgi:hypothetical protein